MLEEGADSLTPREWTGLQGAGGIDRVGPFIDVANDAVLIDHEGDAVGKEASEIEDTVSLGHLLFGVAQAEGNVAPVSSANLRFLSWLSRLIPSTCAPAASNLAISP